jgi:hypothetical protein
MDREAVAAALEAWDAARAALAGLSFDGLTAQELVAVYERREYAHRQDAAIDHTVLAALKRTVTPQDFGGATLKDTLAQRLHLDPADTVRRLRDADQLGPRRSFFGEPLVPQLAATAAALARGEIAVAHVAVIQKYLKKLPRWVDAHTIDRAERDLADIATGLPPEDLDAAARHLVDVVDPDGAEPNHDEQQSKRGLHVGRQQRDGMTRIDGYLDPEAAALLDVVRAKGAAPGANLSEDPGAGDLDTTGPDVKDVRSTAQRDHDAFKAALRTAVGSGALGQLNGVPATIVVTTTLEELESGAGYADTGGGTRLPMRDIIRLAARSRHYLAVFDDHTEEVLYLGRAKRCATTAQRLALFARDKGCTRPGCTAPPYQCQVHHAEQDWSEGGRTDIDALTLACRRDNAMIEETEWTTRRANGRTEWIPPAILDTGQARVNHHHHPQRYLNELARDDDEPE